MYGLWAERNIRRGEHIQDQIVDPARSLADRLARERLRPLLGASDGASRLGHAPKLSHDFRVRTCAP